MGSKGANAGGFEPKSPDSGKISQNSSFLPFQASWGDQARPVSPVSPVNLVQRFSKYWNFG
jgi:hypothetical protein